MLIYDIKINALRIVPLPVGEREQAGVLGTLRNPGRTAADAAGRMCPVDYRYAPSALARPAEFSAEILYVVGGLYGNLAALDPFPEAKVAVADKLTALELKNGHRG